MPERLDGRQARGLPGRIEAEDDTDGGGEGGGQDDRLDRELGPDVEHFVGDDGAGDAIRRHRPDIAVLDINMPGLDGLAVLAAVKAELDTRVVLLAASVNDRQILDAVTNGAWGLVVKTRPTEGLLHCLAEVVDGRRHLPEEIVGPALAREFKRLEAAHRLAEELTPRELEIVGLIADGLPSKEIAARLGISTGTLKVHLNRIYRKTGVSTREELLRLADAYRDYLDQEPS